MADATCDHESAIVVRGSLLLPDDGEPDSFDAAWCPVCGAFREASAFTDEPCKWEVPVTARGPRTDPTHLDNADEWYKPDPDDPTTWRLKCATKSIDPADDVKEPKEAADV